MKLTAKLASIALLCLLPLFTGCNVLGYAAGALPAGDVPAAYAGLANQKVGIMVYSDPATRIEFPSLNADIASAIQADLKDPSLKDAKEVQGAQYLNPLTIVRWQREHPELDALPVEEVAPKLNVSRVIYIEVEDFQTRSPQSIDLFKGSILGSIKVMEVDSNGVARTAYREDQIRVTYPPKSTEGVPGGTTADTRIMYQRTVSLFAANVAKRFFKHPGDE